MTCEGGKGCDDVCPHLHDIAIDGRLVLAHHGQSILEWVEAVLVKEVERVDHCHSVVLVSTASIHVLRRPLMEHLVLLGVMLVTPSRLVELFDPHGMAFRFRGLLKALIKVLINWSL